MISNDCPNTMLPKYLEDTNPVSNEVRSCPVFKYMFFISAFKS